VSLQLIPQTAVAPIRELKLEDRIQLDKDALAIRDEMIANAEKAVPAIITAPDEQLAGRNNAIELKQWLKTAEANMEEINAVLLPLQRRARRLTDEASKPVKELLKSLEMRLTGFALREEARVKREEAERQQKIKEAQELSDRLAKQAAETAQKVTSGDDAEAAAQAELEAFNAAEAERAAVIAKPVEASRQAGLVRSKKKKWKLQDTPDAIHRLYKANPSLVRLEVNAAAVQATVFPGAAPDGLECWWEEATIIRGT